MCLLNMNSQIRIYSIVLDLAGMVLILPIADHTVLCFVFVAGTVLITHQSFSHC